MPRTRPFSTPAGLAAAILFAALCCACVSQPDYYAPPRQREAFAGPDTRHLMHFIQMNNPHAEKHILRDIGSLENGAWRWTGQRPTLRFLVRKVKGLRLVMDFSLSDETLAETGPVTITYYVNAHELGRQTYAKGGEHHYEKPVPLDWLAEGEDVVVSAEFDKVWVSPDDGNKLGCTLIRAGFLD